MPEEALGHTQVNLQVSARQSVVEAGVGHGEENPRIRWRRASSLDVWECEISLGKCAGVRCLPAKGERGQGV